MLNVLENIRSGFRKRRTEQAQERQTAWMRLVERLADGEDVPFEEVELIVDSANASAVPPVCPTSAAHKNIRAQDAQPGKPGRRCICDDCGAVWNQPNQSSDVGEFSVDRLQVDVELLRRRRLLAQRVGNRKKLEQSKQKMESELKRADDALQAARKAYQETYDRLQGSILDVESELRACDQAVAELEQTAMELRPAYATEIRELIEERRTVAKAEAACKAELWGATDGTLSSVFVATVGERWLRLIRAVFNYEGGQVDIQAVKAEGAAWERICRAAERGDYPDHVKQRLSTKEKTFASDVTEYAQIWVAVKAQLETRERLQKRLEEIDNRIKVLNADALKP